MFEPAWIPGMIEPVEQALLSRLAAEVDGRGAIVEFGCFFGRSTACLANGAASWWSPAAGRPAVLAFDSFGCSDGDGFGVPVRAFAKRAGVDGLLRQVGGRLDFHPVYHHFVGAAEASGLLKTTIAELRDTTFAGGDIALMHIDAPKFYEELKYILYRFFPSLTPGAAVVFQDYFYHWSATLVAAVQLLLEGGFIRFEASAASAMLARVVRAPSAAELLELDIAMATTPVPDLLDRSLAAVRQLDMDRPEQFRPRIHLAKVQYLWEQGAFAAAQQAFAATIRDSGGKLGGPVFADFQELMSQGFRLRQLYNRDH